MYCINSEIDKPDIEYMEKRLKEMCSRGINTYNLKRAHSVLLKEQERVKDIIETTCGIQNPNSVDQIRNYIKRMDSSDIYSVCMIDGKISTKADVLEQLRALGFKFAELMLKYREVKAYAQATKSLMDCCDEKGVVHPLVSLTKTNRITYKSPALMNIPKKLLWYLVRANEEKTLYSIDIKNQEPSILINMLSIDELKPVIRHGDGFYTEAFKRVFKNNTTLNIWCFRKDKAKVKDKKGNIVSLGVGLLGSNDMEQIGIFDPIYYSYDKALTSGMSVVHDGITKKVVAVEPVNVVAEFEVEDGDTKADIKLPLKANILVSHENKLGDQVNERLAVTVEWDVEKIKESLKKLKGNGGLIQLNGKLDIESCCLPSERDEFKTCWLALTYGGSEKTLIKYCRLINGKRVYDYFMSIEEFKNYKKSCEKKARENDQVAYTYFGTELYANALKSKLSRVLMNIPVQGTGSDILSLLIKNFDKEVVRLAIENKMSIYYTRHDELVLEVDDTLHETMDVDGLIKSLFEHKIDNWEPFRVEIKKLVVDSNIDFLSLIKDNVA